MVCNQHHFSSACANNKNFVSKLQCQCPDGSVPWVSISHINPNESDCAISPSRSTLTELFFSTTSMSSSEDQRTGLTGAASS